ncbi:ABC transporter substrate-binding protein [Flavobacterium suncheonense]|uniref:ABC transporter substrate-binding protein n=1 Tax=Flavobacterium suncheonense GH29-5 = DSM 17707 TaxID=1121899 RepID=A0A0A2MDD0_9FLAO|nr:ABC transporter substrate-binding protein [Flavobacterium suncheonense]KGO89473.1 ABC transporter substrate-binding protein [Flavobacterium suncheonense GH29-5 = DSM 17707]
MSKKVLLLLMTCFFLLISCKKENTKRETTQKAENSIRHAKGLEIYDYEGYSIVKVTNPWPKAEGGFTYILKKENGIVPDSLQHFTTISVPVKSIIVTSTTHIPSLEMLGMENTLVGFPDTDLISSEKIRTLIDAGKIKNLGQNESINTEIAIDLTPEVLVGFSIDSNNKTFNNLEKAGLKILYNGDWTEQTPLGKAEWVKFFGALYDKKQQAEAIFKSIEKEYTEAVKMVQKTAKRPTALSGGMFQDTWNLPQGDSWVALFMKDANIDYLWNDSKGTGSLALSFEQVLEKAQNADYWFAPGMFSTLKEMKETNSHYAQFKAFQTGNVYSVTVKKGAKGGIRYYEQASNRPDLVLKDLIKITNPELLPEYDLYFFQKLN